MVGLGLSWLKQGDMDAQWEYQALKKQEHFKNPNIWTSF